MVNHKLPELGSFVIATAKKVYEHGAYFFLDEYNIEAYMPIGEVSPTRAFDINDIIKVGKKYVCKVIRVDKTRLQVDISLKRVTESERRRKLLEWKRNQKGLKLIEILASKINYPKEKILSLFNKLVSEKFEDYLAIFESYARNPSIIKELNVDSNFEKALSEIVSKYIKLPTVEVEAEFTLFSFLPNGVNLLKKAINIAENSLKDKNIKYRIIFQGSPKYKLEIIAENYKIAEECLKTFESILSDFSTKNNLNFSFKRIK